ncbi:hypothetical protein, partial [Streptomyces sp. NPDC026673]|uniref:hypothetical protein n=1 Tax=Streptomyces sp. NPDC026673 TaxID=3155724 RepID=UPI0033C7011E
MPKSEPNGSIMSRRGNPLKWWTRRKARNKTPLTGDQDGNGLIESEKPKSESRTANPLQRVAEKEIGSAKLETTKGKPGGAGETVS